MTAALAQGTLRAEGRTTMHASVEQWIPILVARGAVLSLVFLTLLLAGMLSAGFGGLSRSARV
jgi:hypothetical protein